jgi:hypothetical protein
MGCIAGELPIDPRALREDDSRVAMLLDMAFFLPIYLLTQVIFKD